jgi:phosphate transport system permease protein
VTIFVTVGIAYTLLSEGYRGFFSQESLIDFLTGTTWQPVSDKFGVLPLLSASLLIALIAALFAIPIGVGSAIYLSEYAGERFRSIVKPTLELLAGMPTVVLGFFAIEAVMPALISFGTLREGTSFSMLPAGLVVGLLIVPLISSLSEDALRAVPEAMRQGSYGLGATKSVTALKIVLPAALSGVMASIVLGLSRAVGETMVVTLAAGARPNLTLNPTEEGQTITAVIVQISQGEATRGSTQYGSIFAIGVVLFVVTLLINVIASAIVRRYRTVYE